MSPSIPAATARRRRRTIGGLVMVVLAGLLGLWIGRFALSGVFGMQNGAAEPRPVAPRGPLAEGERATIALFERVSSSVVYVSPIERVRALFSLNEFEVPRGTGSGFVWDKQGNIVTNFHVIAGVLSDEPRRGDKVARVMLHDNSSYYGTLAGISPDKDVAVLHIDAPARLLYPVDVGTSSDLRVGQNVLAIGNPFGLDYTLTTGVVSALNREIKSLAGRTIQGVIQTDAAINPGNSGGPLLDSAGRLVGMNTAILSPSGSSAGIGFAVPVDVINRVVPQLIMHGRLVQPGLGVVLASDDVARRLELNGVIVLTISHDAAAERAGLRGVRERSDGSVALGDIITKVGKTPTPTRDSLLNALEHYSVGDTVELTIERDDREQKVKVKLQQLD